MSVAPSGVDRSDGAELIDVAAERARTHGAPAAFRGAHHLNSAGAALPSVATVSAIVEHLELEARIGGYEAAAAVVPRLEAVYATAADLLGASASEIALVENASVGWSRFVAALHLGPGDRVLASRSTYVNSALALLELEHRGVHLEILPNDAAGHVDLGALAAALERPAALVVATHVPTSSGMVEPVAAIGALTRAAGVPYLLDATQSVGQLEIDVAAFGCDALVSTGRKFLRAPRGTGLLYVESGLCERLRPLAPDVRAARWTADHAFEVSAGARRFETWEAAHALRLGMGVALTEARALGVERIGAHVTALSALLRERLLAAVPTVQLADPGEPASGIVTFVRSDEAPGETLQRLAARGCHLVTVPDHHGFWDLAPKGLAAVVRASFHVYNDADDVEALVSAVAGRPPAPGSQVAFDGFASRPRESADVVVVGAGIHGVSAAWELARRGVDVILLEQFRAGHRLGSSHGVSRMIRRAYPSAIWDGLVDRAYRSWAVVEAAAGVPLLTTTGGLFAHPVQDAGLRGPGCELLSARDAEAMFGALALGDEFAALHDPAAGVIDAAGALAAIRELAVAAGARVLEASPALAIDDDGDGVTVSTPTGTIRAAKVVVAAGPWVGDLVPDLAPAFRVERIVNVHLRAADLAAVSPPALGVFSVQIPGVGLLYGIPAIGGHGLKVGLDDGPPDDPSRRPPPVSTAEIERLREQVRRFLPVGDGPLEAALACRYTRTANNRFAVGPLPDRPHVILAAACSGHGFKFGPALGEAVADLATGVDRPDLAFLDPAALPRGIGVGAGAGADT